MPISVTTDEMGFTNLRLRGVITLKDLIGAQAILAVTPFLNRPIALLDLTDVQPNVTCKELRSFAQRWPVCCRLAILAPTPTTFGLARMYEMLCSEAADVTVVKTREEAIQWMYGFSEA